MRHTAAAAAGAMAGIIFSSARPRWFSQLHHTFVAPGVCSLYEQTQCVIFVRSPKMAQIWLPRTIIKPGCENILLPPFPIKKVVGLGVTTVRCCVAADCNSSEAPVFSSSLVLSCRAASYKNTFTVFDPPQACLGRISNICHKLVPNWYGS